MRDFTDATATALGALSHLRIPEGCSSSELAGMRRFSTAKLVNPSAGKGAGIAPQPTDLIVEQMPY